MQVMITTALVASDEVWVVLERIAHSTVEPSRRLVKARCLLVAADLVQNRIFHGIR